MGKKGRDPPGLQRSVGSDVIYAERRGQSQKPEEIYQLIEELVPGGAAPGRALAPCLSSCGARRCIPASFEYAAQGWAHVSACCGRVYHVQPAKCLQES